MLVVSVHWGSEAVSVMRVGSFDVLIIHVIICFCVGGNNI